jgi:hypothetical protein
MASLLDLAALIRMFCVRFVSGRALGMMIISGREAAE